jgi:hypothetical protein
MLGLLCSALAFHAPLLSRRQIVTGFLSATPGFAVFPARTSANVLGGEGPQSQLAALVRAQADLAVLEVTRAYWSPLHSIKPDQLNVILAQAQLQSGGIKNSDDDAMVVLRTVAVQQSGTAELMDKALALSPTLDPDQRTRASQAASSFAQQVREQQCAPAKSGCARSAACHCLPWR